MTYVITESIFQCTAILAIVVMYFTTRFVGIDIIESMAKIPTGDLNALLLVVIHYGLAFMLTGLILTIIFG